MGKCSKLIYKYFWCYCNILNIFGSDLNVRCVCVCLENFISEDCINVSLTNISSTQYVL